ncbi:MAG: hypothetical protein FJ253_06000 [Phycisphaerae bacterium]|nr:hypothetical protein [Phycisphaerae bacterium]
MPRTHRLAASLLFLCSASYAQVVPAIPQSVTDARNAFLDQNPATGFTELGTLVERVWGRAFSTGTTPINSAQTFVDSHSGIWGVPPSQLVPIGPFDDGSHVVPILYDSASESYLFTGVYFSQQLAGIPVYGAHLRCLIRNEPGFPMVLASSTLRDVSSLDGAFRAGALGVPNPAIYTRVALDQFRQRPQVSPAEWVIWAGLDDQTPQPQLAIKFTAVGGSHLDPTNHMAMLYVVDADDGSILHQESLIYHADVGGTVFGNATTGSKSDACNPEANIGLPYAAVTSSQGTHYADANGVFTIPWPNGTPLSVTSTIAGLYFFVISDNGGNLSLNANIPSGGTTSFIHNALNNSEFSRAQVNAYLHANIARDWILSANPSYPTITSQSNFQITVNIASTCNAFYSNSTINFYASGGGCPNTAFASVVAHEYGHNMVDKGGSGQGAYGEGMSDCLSVVVYDESILAYGWSGNCNSGLRNADNNCQYQTSGCSSCGSAIHSCGQLLSGCVWDLREQLAAKYPADYRPRLADLVVNSVLVHGGSSITPSITVDFLTLNDDNGDITDGTPDYAEINAAFTAHSMPGPALSPIKFNYPSGLPALASPAGATTFPVHVQPLGGNPVAGTGKLYWRFGTSGAFSSAFMTQGAPNQYTASIPAGPCPGVVQFYVESGVQGGGTATSPAGAPTAVFGAPVAASQSILLADSFETNLGWSYGVVGDTATTGAWLRANPIGTAAQPENDFTADPGVNCAFTGQGTIGGSLGEADVDNGITTLMSPAFDATGNDDVYFTAWVWYSNNTGANPNQDTMPVQVSNNGGASWVTMQSINSNANAWVLHSWRLQDFVTLTNNMRVRFRAQDTDPQSLVEAAVDDVEVLAFSCTASNPYDLNGDGVVDGDDLGTLLGQWGPCPGCSADFNGDGEVDGDDLGALLGNWT